MRGRCDCTAGRRRDPWLIRDLGGEDFETTECPAQLVTADSWGLLNLYPHYRNGFLPMAGGLLDQPNRFSEAMLIIAAETNSD